MWLFLFSIISSTSLWAGGADLYHWKDLELPNADKDRLFINYEMPNDKQINFPAIRLYNNRDMKGKPEFEFTARGTLEKGDLKCAIDNFACQYGPIYKRPWGYRDGQFFVVYFPIERQIDESTFEIKHGGLSYFLSLSNLKNYKSTVVKFDDAGRQGGQYYWIQRSHPYLVQKFQEKMPRFEEEKKIAISCLRSTNDTCANKYNFLGSLLQMKKMLLEHSDPSVPQFHGPISQFDYSVSNIEVRNALATCLEHGKALVDPSSKDTKERFHQTFKFYSAAKIKMSHDLNFEFECSFTFIIDKIGKSDSIKLGLLHIPEI